MKRGIPSMQIEMDKIQEKLKEQPSNEIDGLEAAKRVSHINIFALSSFSGVISLDRNCKMSKTSFMIRSAP